MSKRVVLSLGLGMALSLGIGLYLAQDRILTHQRLAELGSADPAVVDHALSALYDAEPTAADRLVVRHFINKADADHAVLIDALRAMGKAAVIPRPARRRYAQAALADPGVSDERKREEASYLIGHSDDDPVDRLAECLPYLEPSAALYAMLAASDAEIDQRLLGFAREGDGATASAAIALIAMGEKDHQLAARLVDLPARSELTRPAVLQAALSRGGLAAESLSKQRVVRLLAQGDGASAELSSELLARAMRGGGKLPYAALRAAVEDREQPVALRVRLTEALAATPGADASWLLARLGEKEDRLVATVLEVLAKRPTEGLRLAVSALPPAQREALGVRLEGLIGGRPAGRARALVALSALVPGLGRAVSARMALTVVALYRDSRQADERDGAHRLLQALRPLPKGAAQALAAIAIDRHQDAARREQSLALIASRSDVPEAGQLRALLAHGGTSASLKSAALAILVDRKLAKPVTLRPLLGSSDMQLARVAGQGLLRHGEIEPVIKAMQAHDVLRDALLVELATHAATSAGPLIDAALGSELTSARQAGIRAAVASADPRRAGALLALCRTASVSDETRRLAGQACAAIGDASARNELAEALVAGPPGLSSETRLLIASALTLAGTRSVHKALLALLGDENTLVANGANQALRELAKRVHGAAPAIEGAAQWGRWWDSKR